MKDLYNRIPPHQGQAKGSIKYICGKQSTHASKGKICIHLYSTFLFQGTFFGGIFFATTPTTHFIY
jgi:hypothetical protein